MLRRGEGRRSGLAGFRCAIGEVLGMVIGTALGLHNAAIVVLAIAMAFVFGYALTVRPTR